MKRTMFSQFFRRDSSDPKPTTPATQQDVASGKAIFCVPNGLSLVFDLGVALPAEGYVKRPIAVKGGNPVPVGTPLTILQAETGPKDKVMVGAVILGKKFVCTLDDVALGKPEATDQAR
jgi:hypothetical protein